MESTLIITRWSSRNSGGRQSTVSGREVNESGPYCPRGHLLNWGGDTATDTTPRTLSRQRRKEAMYADGWHCDRWSICRTQSNTNTTLRWNCVECGFDICGNCIPLTDIVTSSKLLPVSNVNRKNVIAPRISVLLPDDQTSPLPLQSNRKPLLNLDFECSGSLSPFGGSVGTVDSFKPNESFFPHSLGISVPRTPRSRIPSAQCSPTNSDRPQYVQLIQPHWSPVGSKQISIWEPTFKEFKQPLNLPVKGKPTTLLSGSLKNKFSLNTRYSTDLSRIGRFLGSELTETEQQPPQAGSIAELLAEAVPGGIKKKRKPRNSGIALVSKLKSRKRGATVLDKNSIPVQEKVARKVIDTDESSDRSQLSLQLIAEVELLSLLKDVQGGWWERSTCLYTTILGFLIYRNTTDVSVIRADSIPTDPTDEANDSTTTTTTVLCVDGVDIRSLSVSVIEWCDGEVWLRDPTVPSYYLEVILHSCDDVEIRKLVSIALSTGIDKNTLTQVSFEKPSPYWRPEPISDDMRTPTPQVLWETRYSHLKFTSRFAATATSNKIMRFYRKRLSLGVDLVESILDTLILPETVHAHVALLDLIECFWDEHGRKFPKYRYKGSEPRIGKQLSLFVTTLSSLSGYDVDKMVGIPVDDINVTRTSDKIQNDVNMYSKQFIKGERNTILLEALFVATENWQTASATDPLQCEKLLPIFGMFSAEAEPLESARKSIQHNTVDDCDKEVLDVTLYRGGPLLEYLLPRLRSLAVDDLLQWCSPTLSTRRENFAYDTAAKFSTGGTGGIDYVGVLWKISGVKEGIPTGKCWDFPEDGEVILPPLSLYKVTQKPKMIRGVWTVAITEYHRDNVFRTYCADEAARAETRLKKIYARLQDCDHRIRFQISSTASESEMEILSDLIRKTVSPISFFYATRIGNSDSRIRLAKSTANWIRSVINKERYLDQKIATTTLQVMMALYKRLTDNGTLECSDISSSNPLSEMSIDHEEQSLTLFTEAVNATACEILMLQPVADSLSDCSASTLREINDIRYRDASYVIGISTDVAALINESLDYCTEQGACYRKWVLANQHFNFSKIFNLSNTVSLSTMKQRNIQEIKYVDSLAFLLQLLLQVVITKPQDASCGTILFPKEIYESVIWDKIILLLTNIGSLGGFKISTEIRKTDGDDCKDRFDRSNDDNDNYSEEEGMNYESDCSEASVVSDIDWDSVYGVPKKRVTSYVKPIVLAAIMSVNVLISILNAKKISSKVAAATAGVLIPIVAMSRLAPEKFMINLIQLSLFIASRYEQGLMTLLMAAVPELARQPSVEICSVVCTAGKSSKSSRFIQTAVSLTAPDALRQAIDFRNTALHISCRTGDQYLTLKLLQAGCNIEAVNYLNAMPFHEAIAADCSIAFGSDLPDHRYISSPPIRSMFEGKLGSELIQLLLTNNVVCQHQGKLHETALHMCCRHGLIDISHAIVILSGSDCCNVLNNLGMTPLHYACMSSEFNLTLEGQRVLQKLVTVEASEVFASDVGTPLHVAATYGMSYSVSLLLSIGSDPNYRSTISSPVQISQDAQGLSVGEHFRCLELLTSDPSDLRDLPVGRSLVQRKKSRESSFRR